MTAWKIISKVAAVVPVTSVEVTCSEAMLALSFSILLVKCLMKILGRSAYVLRKNDLQIEGIEHSYSENCVNIATAFKEITDRDVNIERSHRDGRVLTGKGRHVLSKVTSYQDKVEIMINENRFLKGMPIHITDNLT